MNRPSTPATSTALRRSPLQAAHEALGATFAPFSGWWLPLRYQSELVEHHATRRSAGLFDVSHMGEIVVHGPRADEGLDFALASSCSALAPGRARYTVICDTTGGVIDDLVVYRLSPDEFLVVANAGNRFTVAAELTARVARYGATVRDASDETALLSLQGPRSLEVLGALSSPELGALKRFAITDATIGTRNARVARTGYTGEDGFESFLAPSDAVAIWQRLLEAEPIGIVTPVGLAARDSLRLEAGLALYGHELTLATTPFDAGLARLVDFAKPDGFVGAEALAVRARERGERTLVGLRGEGTRVRRGPTTRLFSLAGDVIGSVTSGGPSPSLGIPIAMAYVCPEAAALGTTVLVDVRGRNERAEVVALPFYRRPTPTV